jgi:hypothetical protein
MEVEPGHEDLSFEDAIAREEERLPAASDGLREMVGIDPETWTTITPWEELSGTRPSAD